MVLPDPLDEESDSSSEASSDNESSDDDDEEEGIEVISAEDSSDEEAKMRLIREQNAQVTQIGPPVPPTASKSSTLEKGIDAS